MEELNLWDKTLEVSKKALLSRSLQPFKTKLEKLIGDDNSCEIRTLIDKPRTQLAKPKPIPNPFKPWQKELEICEVGDNHVLILNKYPVELGHTLLITKDWQPQDGWITYNDFKALNLLELELSGFWFFNNSPSAGASQPHRHLQFLKRDNTKLLFPRQTWFNKRIETLNQNDNLSKSIHILRRKHSNDINTTDELFNLYLKLCEIMKVGLPNVDKKPQVPHNLLITRKWISLIRRSKESHRGFDINALGFAGYFLATPKSDVRWLMKYKSEKLLSAVVKPIKS